MKKENLPNLFVFWSIIEALGALVLYFRLPENIQVNFGYIMTTPVSQGTKAYVFVLPVVMFVAAIIFRAFSKNYNQMLQIILLALNILILLGTTFYLVQLIFM